MHRDGTFGDIRQQIHDGLDGLVELQVGKIFRHVPRRYIWAVEDTVVKGSNRFINPRTNLNAKCVCRDWISAMQLDHYYIN